MRATMCFLSSTWTFGLLVVTTTITSRAYCQDITDESVRVVDSNAPDPPIPCQTPGFGTGQCWENAFTDLQQALEEAAVPESGISQIWVAVGTGPYAPPIADLVASGSDIRTTTFQMPPNVKVYGGFLGNALGIGNGETDLHDRNPEANETILSGILDDPSAGLQPCDEPPP